jgi:hypothetical protein
LCCTCSPCFTHASAARGASGASAPPATRRPLLSYSCCVHSSCRIPPCPPLREARAVPRVRPSRLRVLICPIVLCCNYCIASIACNAIERCVWHPRPSPAAASSASFPAASITLTRHPSPLTQRGRMHPGDEAAAGTARVCVCAFVRACVRACLCAVVCVRACVRACVRVLEGGRGRVSSPGPRGLSLCLSADSPLPAGASAPPPACECPVQCLCAYGPLRGGGLSADRAPSRGGAVSRQGPFEGGGLSADRAPSGRRVRPFCMAGHARMTGRPALPAGPAPCNGPAPRSVRRVRPPGLRVSCAQCLCGACRLPAHAYLFRVAPMLPWCCVCAVCVCQPCCLVCCSCAVLIPPLHSFLLSIHSCVTHVALCCMYALPRSNTQ